MPSRQQYLQWSPSKSVLVLKVGIYVSAMLYCKMPTSPMRNAMGSGRNYRVRSNLLIIGLSNHLGLLGKATTTHGTPRRACYTLRSGN